ncbi:MAG: ABC transporter permease [Gammaproteobacteria bacterium]
MSAPPPGLWARAGRRFLRNRAAAASLVVFGLIALACLLGPWLAPQSVETLDPLLARTLEGGRTSLRVGLLATLLGTAIGVAWGAAAGWFGGRLDTLMLGAVDLLRPLTLVFLAILLVVASGRPFAPAFGAVGAILWLDTARAVRDRMRSLQRSPFVDAARLAALPMPAIARVHLAPNLLGVVLACAALTLPQAIVIESLLSGLGLGVQPATSWGTLLGAGAVDVAIAPWTLLFPAGVLATTLLCLNVLGTALREALELRPG